MAGSYGGGNLVLDGLLDDPRLKTIGFPLNGEEGLLIAFRSETYHEVIAVTRGERYSIAAWYY